MSSDSNISVGGKVEEAKWHEPLSRTGRALLEWGCHTLIVISLLAGIRLVEAAVHRFWPPNGRLLFDRLPLSYVFDGADLAVLVGFLTYGVYCTVRAYMKRQ